MSKITDNESNYDAKRLSSVLTKCKAGDSTAEFSRKTGVSITYLTKLLNGNSPSRPSKKYLQRIAYPEFGSGNREVTYRELLSAAGYSITPEDEEAIDQETNIVIPEFVKRPSFPLSFMIDNLLEDGEIESEYEIYHSKTNGWFIIESKSNKILCVPAIFEGKDNKDKTQLIAIEFMVAVTTQSNINRHYILTNQRELSERIKNVIPKLPNIDMYVLETEDYQRISERKLVY